MELAQLRETSDIISTLTSGKHYYDDRLGKAFNVFCKASDVSRSYSMISYLTDLALSVIKPHQASNNFR